MTTTQPGFVTIDAREVTSTPPTGFFLLNQEFDITAPPADDALHPLRLVFTIDGDSVPAGPITVFQDGDPVADPCTGATGVASPNPCVAEAVRVDPDDPDSDLRITVLTTEASVWQFGVSAAPPPAVTAVGPVHGWIGLKNSDDQGTQFDLKTELLKNGTPVASGLKRCVTGVTRNPSLATEAVVPWDQFEDVPTSSGDTLSLRLSTRVGTNADSTKCPGPGGSHSSAVGLRLYYDSAARASAFDATIAPDPSQARYLHSNGNACANSESTGVTSRFLDSTAPNAANAKCKDSAAVKFAGGNAWKDIGTWSLAPLP